jgi:hypothetical protein
MGEGDPTALSDEAVGEGGILAETLLVITGGCLE